MRAVILAAGYGRRMRPLTRERHKSMLVVGGETVFARMVGGLLAHGIADICVVTGYRADEVEQYLVESFPEAAFTFVRNEAYATTNNVWSIALALETIPLDRDLVLIEADVVFEPAVLGQLLSCPHPNVALVDHFANGMDGTVVTLGDGGRITSVITPAMQPSTFDFADKYKTLNVYKFSAEFCRTSFRQILGFYTRSIDVTAYYELVLGVLVYIQQAEIRGEVVQGRWAEIDDPNDLRVAEFLFRPETAKDLLDEAWGGMWSTPVTDFAFIRNMYFPTPSMLSELRSNLPELLHNYGSSQALLDAKMSYFLECPPAHVVALNGASQAYPILGHRYGGARVLVGHPTFGEYQRAFPGADTYEDAFAVDLDEVDRRCDHDLVVVVNPNNPTGTVTATAALLDVARRHPNTMWLVDESFIEFSGQPSAIPMLEADPLPNLAVLKSLSKSWGVPGVRLGYLYNQGELAAQVRAELPVWNMNAVAESFLELVLKHRLDLQASIERTVADRAAFVDDLRRLPGVVEALEGGANFVLAALDLEPVVAETLARRLVADHGVYVKDVSAKLGRGRVWWRLAVRTPEDHQRLCTAYRSARSRIVDG